MVKKLIALVMLTTLLISTIVTPANVNASKQINEKISIRDLDIELEILDTTNNRLTLNVIGESFSDTVEVFLDTGDFIIENEDGVRELFNIKDFDSPDNYGELSSVEKVKIEKSINDNVTPLEIVTNKRYLGGMQEELGFSNSTIMQNTGNYIYAGYYVQVFSGTEWKYIEVPKKYTFTVGTAVSVILGVIAAILGAGFSLSALMVIFQSLGITFVGETINQTINPTIGVKQKNVGRYFFVYGHGGTAKTLHSYNYLEVAEKGKISLEHYSTDTLNNIWYHNYSDTNVAEVAAERYRWLAGLRQNAPGRTEFSWSW